VETERFERVMEFVAAMSLAGFHVYSPITHFHPVAVRHAMPTDFEFWGGVCRTMIDSCSAVVVAVMDGWETSVGIAGEVEHAHSIGKSVYMMEMADGLVKTTCVHPNPP
jgi:hypothetical protein